MMAITPGAAETQEADFSIPPAPLDQALAAFSVQSGIDVGAAGSGYSAVRSAGVSGRMNPGRALDRILAGTPWRAMPIAGGGFRLVQRPQLFHHSPPPPPPPSRVLPALPPPPDSILVVANKYGTSRLRFPGAFSLIERERLTLAINGDQGLVDAIVQAPTLQSTALGPGRNKLFIRGVADSSFLGPSQATTSVYFGEVQLAYNGADPNLKLVDVDQVEVLEGPQGTLYGAGSIGGVIRIAPNAPDLSRIAASVTGGYTVTEGASPGNDVSGMLNLPLLSHHAALRVVAYRSQDGGYVNDSMRHLPDINRTRTSGGRVAGRVELGDGWTIDLGGILQSITARDSQYAQRMLPGLSRASNMAQPFENDFALGMGTIAKHWDSGLSLVSATGYMQTIVDDRFDATLTPRSPLAFDTHNRNWQFTQEVRLSRTTSKGGWVIGGSWLHDRDEIAREYGSPTAQRTLQGVTNVIGALAVFGQATIPIGRRLTLMTGARFTRSRIDSNPALDTRASSFVRGQRESRVDPTAGFSFLLTPRFAWFGRYAQGFRTGGLSVALNIGRVANFAPDSISVVETGLRLEKAGARGISGSIAFSHAIWRNIQADLVNSRGFPYTSNVGNARIDGVEGTLDWSPVAGLRLDAGAFYARSQATNRVNVPTGPNTSRLPDTPRLAAVAGAVYEHAVAGGVGSAGLSGRYVGSSYLDPAASLPIRQGDYATLDLTAGWRHDRLRIDAAIGNLGDIRGDRFALGNPFSVAARDQYTPVRPRSLRIAVTRAW